MNRIAKVGKEKFSYYLKGQISKKALEAYGDVINPSASPESVKKAIDEMIFNPEVSKKDENLVSLLNLCSVNDICLTLLELLAYVFQDKRAYEAVGSIVNGSPDGITIELAMRIAGYSDETSKYLQEINETYEVAKYLFLADDDSSIYISSPMKLDYHLASWMEDVEHREDEFDSFSRLYEMKEKLQVFGTLERINSFAEDVTVYMDEMIKNDYIFEGTNLRQPVNVILTGESGIGRTTASAYIAKACGFALLSVDYNYLVNHPNPIRALRKCIRECIMSGAALCIRNVSSEESSSNEIKNFLLRTRKEYSILGAIPLFIAVTKDVKPLSYLPGKNFWFNMGELSNDEQVGLWEGMLETRPYGDKIETQKIAMMMKLTPGQVEKVLQLMDIEYTIDPSEMSIAKLTEKCYEILDDGRYNNMKHIRSTIRLEDLKTSERNIAMIRNACNQVIYRRKVFEAWNMKSKFSYGRCVSMLLAGPPGTGKTMAVHAISSELGLELYKVDLSQLVDKYIGETQKRLEEVFKKAEISNMILFFDEADAIMGKRSETKDSHDKYANTEIAYILQRMEEFDGIVILATNYIQNIDVAFMRRIRYVINFEKPDEALRKEIWVHSFAKEAPLSSDIDFDFLAKQFELSGGNIKNIVLNASFLAAAEGSEIRMEHIIKAVYYENNKDKRMGFTTDYGEYSYLVGF